MRRLDAALTRKLGLTLVVAVVLMLVLATVASAWSSEAVGPEIPGRPHWFYGNVRTDCGRTLPAGTLVTARSTEPGWTGEATTTVDSLSRYGYDSAFYVPGRGSDPAGSGAVPGEPIAFYVGGVWARLYDVATGTWSDTYPFKDAGSTNLDLMIVVGSTITASAGPGGSISPSGSVNVACGADQTFTITPGTGYVIADVKVDGVSQGPIPSYTFPNVTANHTIEATFARIFYTITATAGPGGSISPSGAVSVEYGADQTFTITPSTGYAVADVKVDGVSQGPITSYTFPNVTANHTIEVTFSKVIYLKYLTLIEVY